MRTKLDVDPYSVIREPLRALVRETFPGAWLEGETGADGRVRTALFIPYKIGESFASAPDWGALFHQFQCRPLLDGAQERDFR